MIVEFAYDIGEELTIPSEHGNWPPDTETVTVKALQVDQVRKQVMVTHEGAHTGGRRLIWLDERHLANVVAEVPKWQEAERVAEFEAEKQRAEATSP